MNMCFDAIAVVVRVSRWVQLHRVSEEHRALAIQMDAAALVEDLAALSGPRQDLGDLAGNGIVIVPRKLGILAPSVELPVDGDECFILHHKDGSDISEPRVALL